MSLEEFYYISQILASVAVLASLIYLALQTRQTARNQQAQMHIMRLQNVRDDVRKQADPAFQPIFRAGLMGDPNLQTTDGVQFVLYVYGLLQNFQEQYHEWQEGMINDRRWEPSQYAMREFLSFPGFRAAYQLHRSRLDAEFATLADKLIAEGRKMSIESGAFEKWQQLAAAEHGPTETP
jgi:hypothetical protein